MSYLAKEVVDIIKQPLKQFAERSKKVPVKLCQPDLEPISILQLHPDLSEIPTNKVANYLANKYKDDRQICQSWLMLAGQIYEVEDPDGFSEWVAFHAAIGIEPENFLLRIGEIGSVPGRYSPF